MSIHIATKSRLDLDEFQQRRLVRFNKLDEVQLRARQVIEVAQAETKKKSKMKVKKWMFEAGDLVMICDLRHFYKAHKKLLSKWSGP